MPSKQTPGPLPLLKTIFAASMVSACVHYGFKTMTGHDMKGFIPCASEYAQLHCTMVVHLQGHTSQSGSPPSAPDSES